MYAPRHHVKFLVRVRPPGEKPGSDSDATKRTISYLLGLKSVLQLQPQSVWLVWNAPPRPESGSGLHPHHGVPGAGAHGTPQGVEALVLQGVPPPLGEVRGRGCKLLGVHGGLLVHQHGVLLELVLLQGLVLEDTRGTQIYTDARESWVTEIELE